MLPQRVLRVVSPTTYRGNFGYWDRRSLSSGFSTGFEEREVLSFFAALRAARGGKTCVQGANTRGKTCVQPS